MKMKFLLGLIALGLGVCVANAQERTKAIAVLHPTAGNNVTGSVTFTQSGETVKVVADVTGLTPGKHGFHIHEFGDCSSGDGSSAGGHFNPTHKRNGASDASDRHAGDMRNIAAGVSRKAHLEGSDEVIELSGVGS